MRKFRLWVTILTAVICVGCGASTYGTPETGEQTKAAGGEVAILQSWQGDYPVAQLKWLPEKQRELAVGFIDEAETFEDVWKAFNPGEAIPEIDFKANLVLFVYNTQFYNRISVGKVNVTNGVAELLAMETMSALPIEYKAAMSIVVVVRKGILGIQAGHEVISVKDNRW
jgi:hypothetical protein